MPNVTYGKQNIPYTFQAQEGLKSHYISVQREQGVVLKGSPIDLEKQQAMILKKARWILDKLELVASVAEDDIITGSRMQYLGRRYYLELFIDPGLSEIVIDFTASRFKLHLPEELNTQPQLRAAFDAFFKQKAIERITPRVKKWSLSTGLNYQKLSFKKLEKRWGSCTPSNNIVINIDAVKLPWSLIDYLIVHELVHTKVKNHSKAFWAEVARIMPGWRELDRRMAGMKL